MSLLSILFGRLPGISLKTINLLPVDAFVQETITYSAEVTENPIETGGIVSDHLYTRPTELRVQGVVDGVKRDFAYQTLVSMHEARAPLFISTGLQTFDNMALVELLVPRVAETADSLQFTAIFKELRFVSAATTQSEGAPSQSGGAADSAAPTARAGRVQPTPAAPANASAAASTAANTGAAPQGSFLSRLF
jgi:hypothetical protein